MFGNLISAGASLLGGLMQSKQADKQADLQKQFAQSGIQWKVKDAEKAGIHPLYALGANTTSYQPVSVGDLGISQAGQDIGRAIDSTRSVSGKAEALQLSLAQAQVEGANLDNDIKRADLLSKVATRHPTGVGPGMPSDISAASPFAIDGQGNAVKMDGPELKYQSRVDLSNPDTPWVTPHASPDVTFSRNQWGGFDPRVPVELAESMEPDRIGMALWMLQNRILPNFGIVPRPELPGQQPWENAYWHHGTQSWHRGYAGMPIRNKLYYD